MIVDESSSVITPKELLKQRIRSIDPEFRYYKSLFNTTPDLIAVTDGDKIVDANSSFVRFFTALGIDVYAPDFSLSGIFEKVDKYGYVYDGYGMRRWFETILHKDKYHYRVAIAGKGRMFDFNIAIQFLEPANDVFVTTLTDVSEMMGYKSLLEESFRSSVQDKEEAEFLLQQYDNAMNVASLIAKSDLDGTITYVNDAFCKVLKYERDELIGDNVLIFCIPNEDDVCYESIWEIIENGNIWKGVLQNVDKEGEIHYFDTTVVPIKDRSGEVVEYLSVRHEISEMVRAKEKAVQTLEAKNKFFDQVSHELRTPLNAIVNFTDQALESFDEMFEDLDSRDMVKLYIERAYKNSQNLLYLINSLLDMAKLKAGKETFAIAPYDVVQLVRETYENCSSLSKNTNVDYRFQANCSSLWINCDPLKFRQIITNLVSNAFKFTKNGFIEIRVDEAGDGCLIAIEDSGIGIPEKKLSSVFEPFQQARAHDHGTGLGLSIVKEYTQAMGFVLDIHSSEGVGTCFTLKAKKIATKASVEWNI